jgi:hypothetical protein
MKSPRLILTALLILALALLTACSESTAPDNVNGNIGNAGMEGNLDPGAGTFVLKAIDLTNPEGPPVRVQLIGSEMTTDPDLDHVELMVSVRSLHPQPLYPPVLILLKDFQPEEVTVLNPDFLLPIYGPDGSPIGEDVYGFDYSGLLGEDEVLSPEETSQPRLWRFHSPGLAPFSFGAEGEFGLEPGLAELGGFCWIDENRNGQPDPDEAPLPHGYVQVRTPGGDMHEVMVGPDARWGLHVFEAGLYEVFYDPLIDTFVPIAFSTPNPVQVVLTAGPDGELQSFLDGNFGMYTDLPPGPPWIQFTNSPPDSLHYELWDLQGVEIQNDGFLELEVGFSGCQPDHPFSLWMTGEFMESYPVQANLVLRHGLAEDCDAYFTAEKLFNLLPLQERFLEAYGPGVLLLNVMDFHGEITQVEWEIYPEDWLEDESEG